jgi:hypothetical protein
MTSMITLTQFQFILLSKLARAKVKVFAGTKGVPTDKYRERIDQDFADTKALVDADLVADVTGLPKYSEMREKYMEDEGRELLIIQMGPHAQKMFEHHPGGQWSN